MISPVLVDFHVSPNIRKFVRSIAKISKHLQLWVHPCGLLGLINRFYLFIYYGIIGWLVDCISIHWIGFDEKLRLFSLLDYVSQVVSDKKTSPKSDSLKHQSLSSSPLKSRSNQVSMRIMKPSREETKPSGEEITPCHLVKVQLSTKDWNQSILWDELSPSLHDLGKVYKKLLCIKLIKNMSSLPGLNFYEIDGTSRMLCIIEMLHFLLQLKHCRKLQLQRVSFGP